MSSNVEGQKRDFSEVLEIFKEWSNEVLSNEVNSTEYKDIKKIVQSLEEFAKVQFDSISETGTAELQVAFSKVLQEWSSFDQERQFGFRNKEPQNNLSIFDYVLSFFQDDDWSFTRLQGESALRLAFASDRAQWKCFAQVREEQKQFVFYSICPIAVPEPQRMAIAEFITRANYCMIIGNFELDLDDGEIRYKTSIDVEGDRLSHPLIKQLVYTNVLTMDQYLPGIIAVIEQGMEPKEAIALVEP